MRCAHLKIDKHQLTYGENPKFERRVYCTFVPYNVIAIGRANEVPECLTCLRYTTKGANNHEEAK